MTTIQNLSSEINVIHMVKFDVFQHQFYSYVNTVILKKITTVFQWQHFNIVEEFYNK